MTNDITIRPETQMSLSNMIATAHGIVVRDTDSHRSASELLKGCHSLMKAIEADFQPSKDNLNKLKRSLDTQIKGHTVPLEEAKRLLSVKITKWENEERERKRLEDIERQKEAKRQAEEAVIKRAAALEAAGRSFEAEMVLSAPLPPPPAPDAPVEKVAGIRTMVTYDYTVENMIEVPDKFAHRVVWDEGLRAYIKATKGQVAIPGINIIINEKKIATGR